MFVADPPTSCRSWPLQSWACYIQWRPLLVDTIDWQPLTFILGGDAYPCAGGSWTTMHWAPQPQLKGPLTHIFVAA